MLNWGSGKNRFLLGEPKGTCVLNGLGREMFPQGLHECCGLVSHSVIKGLHDHVIWKWCVICLPLKENFSSDLMNSQKAVKRLCSLFNQTLTMLIWLWKSLPRGLWYPSTPWKVGIPLHTLGACIVSYLANLWMSVSPGFTHRHAKCLSCASGDIVLPLLGNTCENPSHRGCHRPHSSAVPEWGGME